MNTQKPQTPKQKYRVIRSMPNPKDTEVILNDLYERGWEVVCSYCIDWFLLREIKR